MIQGQGDNTMNRGGNTMNLLLILSLSLVFAVAHASPLTLGVVLDQNESLADPTTVQRYRAFAGDVERAVGQPVRVHFYTRGFTAIKRARDGVLDMVFAPAHVIANIGKFKFEPVIKTTATTAAAFVAGPQYKGTLAPKSGAYLGMPDYESLMGGLARGEINSRGLAKSDFSEVKFHRMTEAPLFGLKIGRYDLAVAPAEEASAWAAANGGRIVLPSAEVPLRALAANAETVPAGARQKLSNSLQKNSLNLAMAVASKADFKGVASMLNTTPTSLPGAKVINAAEAKRLIEQGVPVYDVRVAEEYETAHIPGAIFLPYNEVSAKEVGFDASEDRFDLNRLPKDKNAAFMLYCDGTVCWKSYKASVMAINAGYKNVLWFRGGFPEWKEAGLPTESRKKN
jgi:rhodanese-related sulfurtransferase